MKGLRLGSGFIDTDDGRGRDPWRQYVKAQIAPSGMDAPGAGRFRPGLVLLETAVSS